jgi:hypothetical protein
VVTDDQGPFLPGKATVLFLSPKVTSLRASFFEGGLWWATFLPAVGSFRLKTLLARHPLPAIPCTIFDGDAARPGLAVDEAVRLQGPVVGEKRPCRPLSAPGERPEGGTATRGCCIHHAGGSKRPPLPSGGPPRSA